MENIRVRSYFYNATDDEWDVAQTVLSQADGTYDFEGLVAGSVRLRFLDPSGSFETEYYNDATTFSGAQGIVVTESGTVSGINASLSPAGRIVGTVTGSGGLPVENAYVELQRWNEDCEEWEWESEAYTTADGTYVAGWLRAGNYRVQFSDDYHVSEYYDNVPEFDLAADVVVTLGTTTGGVDAAMSDKGKISGKVTGPDGVTPLENITVSAYHYDSASDSWSTGMSAQTSSDGTYTVRGVEPGINRVSFMDGNGGYLAEFHYNAATLEEAQDILVGDSGVVGGINASLAVAGRLAGRVTGPDGVTPLKGIFAVVYR